MSVGPIYSAAYLSLPRCSSPIEASHNHNLVPDCVNRWRISDPHHIQQRRARSIKIDRHPASAPAGNFAIAGSLVGSLRIRSRISVRGRRSTARWRSIRRVRRTEPMKGHSKRWVALARPEPWPATSSGFTVKAESPSVIWSVCDQSLEVDRSLDHLSHPDQHDLGGFYWHGLIANLARRLMAWARDGFFLHNLASTSRRVRAARSPAECTRVP